MTDQTKGPAVTHHEACADRREGAKVQVRHRTVLGHLPHGVPKGGALNAGATNLLGPRRLWRCLRFPF